MKITFHLSAKTTRELTTALKSVNVPIDALADLAREHVAGLGNPNGAAFVAEGYTYKTRTDALAVATKLFRWFPGTDSRWFRYRRRGRVVTEEIRNPTTQPAA